MQKHPSFLVRLLIAALLIVFFYFLGYSLNFLNALRGFVVADMNQKITLNKFVKAVSVPNQVNILLLGSDNDQKFTGYPLTQTMMVVHVDYGKNEMDIFSIPRDLWVRMPEREIFGKIGQAAEYEGIPSAIKVVEQNFGIPIDHYGWVGLYGFIKSIDALGGINLQIVRPVLDNAYPTDINNPNPYGYQRLEIQPGMQHLTGELALQYVRSRHEDLIGDFGRIQRQRQLLLALKDTFLNWKSIFVKMPEVFESLKGQIKTDVSPVSSLQLGLFFLTHKNVRVNQYTLSPPIYSLLGTSHDGQNIIVGNATASANLVSEIFGENAGKTTLENLLTVKGVLP